MAATTPAKLKLALASAIAILAIGGLLAARCWAAAPPRVGSPAPAFSLPVVANGSGTVSLDSLKGHAVYLNFFATWCEPCKQEVPYISKLAQAYAKHNVVVIGVDELESPDKVKQFASTYKLGYRLAIDNSGDVGGDYGLLGLPLHVFIAPNGTVAQYKVGEMSEDQVKAALQALAHP
ncbi:MAG TPA: redoxin domain-containing protein [Candidatus Acidoferrales bacterium]|nr:redoxin domain-containing protein [Candidatus Acidoferrales bacterium]